MVRIEKLYKTFGKLPALSDVNAHIPEGRSVAILGPNGSGKTTLMKCILGLVIPDQGSILVDGQDVQRSPEYRNRIGYLPQLTRFPENLNASELIKLLVKLRKNAAGTAEELIQLFEAESFIHKPLGSLSGGMRQKINVILSLMFGSPLLILDEPTVGLDPISRVRFRELLLKEKKAGKTILLTTHLMGEVEEISDEILFLMDGKIYYHGTVAELKSKWNHSNLENAIALMLEQHRHEQHA